MQPDYISHTNSIQQISKSCIIDRQKYIYLVNLSTITHNVLNLFCTIRSPITKSIEMWTNIFYRWSKVSLVLSTTPKSWQKIEINILMYKISITTTILFRVKKGYSWTRTKTYLRTNFLTHQSLIKKRKFIFGQMEGLVLTSFVM